jgi:hypothetical protein
MLDLNFVRGNLALVEAKLRARGADPGALWVEFPRRRYPHFAHRLNFIGELR